MDRKLYDALVEAVLAGEPAAKEELLDFLLEFQVDPAPLVSRVKERLAGLYSEREYRDEAYWQAGRENDEAELASQADRLNVISDEVDAEWELFNAVKDLLEVCPRCDGVYAESIDWYGRVETCPRCCLGMVAPADGEVKVRNVCPF